MAGVDDVANALLKCKDNIEKRGVARLHGDTLGKRGIYVDQCLAPSKDKDLKKIKYYSRINGTIKDKFLTFLEEQFGEPITFSEQGYDGHGHEWDKLLSDYIKSLTTSEPSVSEDSVSQSTDSSSKSGAFSASSSKSNEVAKELIDKLKKNFKIKFLESKFALFGFMRDRNTNERKTPKLYLWQGEADAIAYHETLKKYIVVDFKVINDLLDYWQKKTDLCGKHLHQCLVYAKLLQLHMNLEYLPSIMIAVIDRFTGKQGFFPLFTDVPKECKDKLDEYEWFTEQPPKLPLKVVKNGKLFRNNIMKHKDGVVPSNTPLNKIFKDEATVQDLLEALHLDYDAFEIVSHLDE